VRWNDPNWRREAESWLAERLEAHGRPVTASIEHRHVRPWGTALRVPTESGDVWFKANIPPLSFEVTVLETLGARRPDRVPRLLDADRSRGWMLMEDAGTPLAPEEGDDGPTLEQWERALSAYAQLQLDVARDADALRAGGVPNRTAPAMFDAFEALLDDDRNVRPPGQNGLTDDELTRLRALVPRLREAGETLGALGLPDSIQHDDLHEWNVFLRDGEHVFVDWGDACVAQPTLSATIPLWAVERRFDDPAMVSRARDAYYEPWTALRPHTELLAAHDAAMLLGQVTGTLKWGLINSGLRDDERGDYAGSVPRRLRELLGDA
jgi:hypothetical protein